MVIIGAGPVVGSAMVVGVGIALLQAMTLLALYLVGRLAHLGPWYLAGLAAGAVFFLYHLWLIRGREPDACFHAFLNNHYFGMAVFIGICLSYVF